jgi:hypothetical protein
MAVIHYFAVKPASFSVKPAPFSVKPTPFSFKPTPFSVIPAQAGIQHSHSLDARLRGHDGPGAR